VETVIADAEQSLVRLCGSMTFNEVLGAFRGTTYRVELLKNSGWTGVGQCRP
jgi:hypothetical protein